MNKKLKVVKFKGNSTICLRNLDDVKESIYYLRKNNNDYFYFQNILPLLKIRQWTAVYDKLLRHSQILTSR